MISIHNLKIMDKKAQLEESFPQWKALLDVCEGLADGTIFLNEANEDSAATSSMDIGFSRNFPRKSRVRAEKRHKNESDPPPEMPRILRDMIVGKLSGTDPKLILQKRLFWSDLNPHQRRLLMPFKQLQRNDFLSETEKRKGRERDENNPRRFLGIKVLLIEPNLDVTFLKFKEWDTGRNNFYVLYGGWNNVVQENGLEEGQVVQVWFFRNRKEEPCFALVKLQA